MTVNRIWQEVFGTGLVKTADDFGSQGEPPSHPELLDWLAVDFRESGWDVKRFYRQVLTSATYRQSALTTPEKLAKDPENRLLSRGPRFRMDAEMLRDYALAASGLLAPQIGGPSVKPYQPEGVWEAVAMVGSNTRFYKPDTGERPLPPLALHLLEAERAAGLAWTIFNAPTREVCTVRRERTNTPLQALVTMNDVAVRRGRPRRWPSAAMETPSDFDARLDYHRRARLLARPARTPNERPIARRAYDRFRTLLQRRIPTTPASSWTIGETQARPGARRPPNYAALDHARQPAAEPGRGAEQMTPIRDQSCCPMMTATTTAEALRLDRASHRALRRDAMRSTRWPGNGRRGNPPPLLRARRAGHRRAGPGVAAAARCARAGADSHRRPAGPAPFRAEGEALHLPAPGRRAAADGDLRLQAEDEGAVRQGPARIDPQRASG